MLLRNISAKHGKTLPNQIRGYAEPAELQIEAAAEGEGTKLKKFTMTAYTGGQMRVSGWYHPVVIDIAGMKASRSDMPILKAHDDAHIVGHTSSVDLSAQRIKAAGIVSGVGEAAQEVLSLGANGFPWQASVGADIHEVQFVDKGDKVNVNGKAFVGPVYVARKSTLTEISFVPRGADSATSASVSASKEQDMNEFETWLSDQGFAKDHMSEKQVAAMQATYDRLEAKKAEAAADKGRIDTSADDAVKEIRAKVAAESKRIAAVTTATKNHPDIAAKAIDEGWDENRAELEVLRAERAKAPAIHSHNTLTEMKDGTVLEAAVAVSGNLKNLEKHYDEKTLDASHKAFKGRLGLQDMLTLAARANGYSGMGFRHDTRDVLKAAFSTLSLPGILGNTANKFLLEGFGGVEQVWRDIARIRSVSDFKTITSYRLTDDMVYEEVGKGGELKHGSVGEESYTNRAKTYGKMFAITREDLINDDLGALTDRPRGLGEGAGKRLNVVFWTAFMDNTSFFATTHGGVSINVNFDDGTDSAFSLDALTFAELCFMNMVQPDGTPLSVMPATLLVPNALYVPATRLMQGANLNSTAAITSGGVEYTTNNPHAGKFAVKRSAYLSNATITGNSTKKWYLLASPSDGNLIEVCFLNGVQTPTVESTDADFNTLGIQMRGYHDFGVAKQDYRYGVAMKGES